MKKYQFYDLRKSVSSLLILRIITTAHILTSVPLIQWNIILYGVHSLVQARLGLHHLLNSGTLDRFRCAQGTNRINNNAVF